MSEPTWTSLLPPLLAIALALWSRQVFVSLGAGIWLGAVFLENGQLLGGCRRAIEVVVSVFDDPGNTMVVLFTFVIGALIGTVEASGGVQGFLNWIESTRWLTSPARARLLVWVVGVLIFIEANITILVAGALARPLFDKFRISREKLAYLIDSTSAPICILIPLNAWGAYCLGIMTELGVGDPLNVFLASIPVNFYALAATFLALGVALWGLDWGPMRAAEERTQRGELLWPGAQPLVDETVQALPEPLPIPPRAVNMLLPIAVMVGTMPLGLYVTGNGDMRAGSGSTSVLWAVLAGLAVSWLLMLAQRGMRLDTLTRTSIKGAQGMVPLALIILLALALGRVTRLLGTGDYVAGLAADNLSPALFLPLTFLISAAIAFSTGTSWGTFAIMLPVAVPAASALGLPLAPFVAASLSGGIFGDHASPISDTTIIASMAAATDHIDHVRTQLPYCLAAGGLATLGFLALGLTL